MAKEALKTLQSMFGEMVASFVFGFAVYSAILGSSISQSSADKVIVGLTVGFSGIGVIYSFCDVTIAHFNPAITLAAILTSKIDVLQGLGYMLAQYIGFMLAVCALLVCSPVEYKETLDTIRPGPTDFGATSLNVFFAEFFLTAIFVHIVFATAVNPYKPKVDTEGKFVDPDEKEPVDRRITAPLCIGLTLGFLAFMGLASSGGAFNPGLTFAPMAMSNTWSHFWIYLGGQYLGGLTGGLLQVLVLYKLSSD
ncbi:aquaporin-like protein [Encephalitozoon intestinalis ATCC 50506]|uniref:Aquaporin n=2 Tax=Encephalitozoon intestinalis TaxID=58839 RepID=AQP_ENCIN|nr:aquaporin-like protein [Encephalitozoon intestinalis ATCC 50506]Q1M2P4.1 RecName: Full=Aquaporin [Encephalitozoon intestinalis]AAQ23044.1 aquaporin-like protein [Encephalitozoon intestinalis]ADM11832.1 aquaporin-like protein [Encephalitozoon intestinalis ATCC 50506]UTX45582.1 aquaporin [Encephalitozoon intestinalis]